MSWWLRNYVRITHIPSGISASCNMLRSMYKMKLVTLNMLHSKLAAPASPFMQRDYILDSLPDKQLKEFDEKYGNKLPGP